MKRDYLAIYAYPPLLIMMVSDRITRAIAIYLMCICVSLTWGYWVLASQHNTEQFLIYIPGLVNLGIFLAAFGYSIAQMTPAHNPGATNNIEFPDDNHRNNSAV